MPKAKTPIKRSSLAKAGLSSQKPRETAGRDTINRYDYQFRKTGEAALGLLEDSKIKVVYCDLHDDYVVQCSNESKAEYEFHQVKTKSKESQQWSAQELFGVGARTSVSKMAAGGSIVGKLFHHQLIFDTSCRTVSVVTNAFYVEDIETLLEELSRSKDEKSLSDDSKKWLKKIVTAFERAFDEFDKAVFVNFLKKLKLRANAGPLKDPDKTYAALYLEKIFKYSEVALTYPEALKIADELLALVKEKSISEIPVTITEEELVKSAGISLDDVLRVLSISKPMYETLKAGGDPKAIRSTSQLMHLLAGVPEEAKILACTAKVSWEAWVLKNRHLIPPADFVTLSDRCQKLVNMFAGTRVDLSALDQNIRQVVREFNPKLPKGLKLTVNLIFGFFLTLAVKGQIQ